MRRKTIIFNLFHWINGPAFPAVPELGAWNLMGNENGFQQHFFDAFAVPEITVGFKSGICLWLLSSALAIVRPRCRHLLHLSCTLNARHACTWHHNLLHLRRMRVCVNFHQSSWSFENWGKTTKAKKKVLLPWKAYEIQEIRGSKKAYFFSSRFLIPENIIGIHFSLSSAHGAGCIVITGPRGLRKGFFRRHWNFNHRVDGGKW